MCLKKYLLIFLVSSLIIGCGLVKTTYNNAPALTIWWLDDYFRFTPAQNLVLKPALQGLHDWHRQTQLPGYITLLQDMQASLANAQISPSETCDKLDAIKLNIYTLQIESIPILIEMAPLLTERQLARFQKKLAERSEKWKSEWWQESKEAQIEARQEKAQDFAEKVYGDLNAAQVNILKQSVTEFSVNPAISYDEILRRNLDAFQILSTLQNASLPLEEKSQLVKAGFDRIQKSPNSAYQAHANAVAQHTCATIAQLHATTTPKQKLHAKNWLNDYIVQLSALQLK